MYSPIDTMPIGEVSTDALILNKNGTITAALVFDHAPGPFPANEYETRDQILIKSTGLFPADTIFHYQDRYRRKSWTPAGNGSCPPFLSDPATPTFPADPISKVSTISLFPKHQPAGDRHRGAA